MPTFREHCGLCFQEEVTAQWTHVPHA